MGKINKVLYNVDQRSDNAVETDWMWMARHNIGLDDIKETGGVIGKATTTDPVTGRKTCGIAPLGENGLVPAEYLPSYVDDVQEGYYYNGLFYSDPEHEEPIDGESDKIYVDITDPRGGETYRYNDTSKSFILISAHKSFAHIGVGGNTISATELSDTFKVGQGNGISVVADTSGKKITVGHSNNVTGGECGPTADVTSDSFTVPYVKYDNCGHITAGVNRLITIPCSEIKLWKGSSSGAVHQNLMTIYEGSSAGACAPINFNDENSTVSMVKTPSVGDDGKVLTVVEPGGSYAPYYEWKELPYPAVVDTFNGGTLSYTWYYTGLSSNYSKSAITIAGLEPNKLHTVEFDMYYSQNYASSPEMYVFASASETNSGVPIGYSRISTLIGDPVDGEYPRLINCSWTLNSSSNGEIFINIVGNADSENRTNRVTIHRVNYIVTRLK